MIYQLHFYKNIQIVRYTIVNKKMQLLKKAEKVNYVFDKMDKETQEAVKSLINHLMVAKTKKELNSE